MIWFRGICIWTRIWHDSNDLHAPWGSGDGSQWAAGHLCLWLFCGWAGWLVGWWLGGGCWMASALGTHHQACATHVRQAALQQLPVLARRFGVGGSVLFVHEGQVRGLGEEALLGQSPLQQLRDCPLIITSRSLHHFQQEHHAVTTTKGLWLGLEASGP